MTDTTSKDKTLKVGARKPLSLRRDTDTVRQSFSGGRSKAVVVEKKRRRVPRPGERPDAAVTIVEEAPKPVEAAPPRVELRRAQTDAAPAPRRARWAASCCAR